MSRHRHVRNLNIQEELVDEALSDGGEEDMTLEQQEQMESGMERVRAIIGDEQRSGLSDATLRDVLWEYYFDIGRTIQWAIDEQERRRAVQERKDDFSDDKTLVLSPQGPGIPGSTQYPQSWLQPPIVFDVNRPRIPLIHLAQQQQEQCAREQQEQEEQTKVQELPSSRVIERPSLSTIWEERTLPLGGSRSSTTTDYGTVIGRHKLSSQAETVEAIIESSSATPAFAMYGLSQTNIPPSSSPGSSLLALQPLGKSSETMPSPDQIPEIPDPTSKTSLLPRSEVAVETKPKQSKLSLRASLKARSIVSQSDSSKSEGTTVTGTYSALRPAAQSLAPPSTIAPSFPEDASMPVSSSASSHVRRAINVALEQEVEDKHTNQKQILPKSTPPHSQTRLAPSFIPQPQSLSLTSSSATLPLSRTLNLPSPSQLAGATQSVLPHPQPTIHPVSREDAPQSKKDEGMIVTSSSKGLQQMSKLAMLAQTKMDPRKVPRLPKTTTEYLTPIANGSAVTTAITTQYQSLFSLTDPNHSSVLPKLDLVPVSEVPVNSSSPQKRSTKLAMKIKRGHEGHKPGPLTVESEKVQVVISPMFDPKTAPDGRALPSQFASLLIDGDQQESNKMRSPAQSKGVTSKSNTRRSRKGRQFQVALPTFTVQPTSAFDGPSPDDVIYDRRRGTSLGQPKGQFSGAHKNPTAKEKEKAQKKAEKSNATSPPLSRVSSMSSTPVKSLKKSKTSSSGTSTPTRKTTVDQRQLDLSGLNIESKDNELVPVTEEPLPTLNYAKENLIEEVKGLMEMEREGGKKGISLVVIGHVDAGKSTLMGRLLYELGKMDEKTRMSNERASSKIGKSSFSWAWSFDGTEEERERGITMDIGLQSMSTKNRDITILDAPGHKDFIPNMISGATQADCALLVIDAAVGEFEAGFERGGQTREHLLLVRSLGVTQLVVAINKLDLVQWNQVRYNEICGALRPFLTQSGFSTLKTSFVPVGAMQGINLVSCDSEAAKALYQWYRGPTLVDLLNELEPPIRDYIGPLRIPVSNVFKNQGSNTAVLGRICSGVVQVGEKLKILPGDESAIVRSIDAERVNAPWAAAGSNVTLYLTAVDPVHLNIGSVLCSPADLVPLVASFTARIIVFDIQVPLTAGISVELFHHSRDIPATMSKLLAIVDRATGTVIKSNPRVLTKGVSAEVELNLRSTSMSGALSGVPAIPIEPFSTNKEMGRILVRRGGETIAAGIILKV